MADAANIGSKVLFESICAQARKALVSIMIAESPDSLHVGTGVLVRIGGAEFVLTAAHNVWSSEKNEPMSIAAGQLPELVVAFFRPGNGSVRSVHVPLARVNGCPEPDVAVIELSDTALLHADRRAFEEDEIGFLASDSAARQLVVAGFPAALTQVEEGLVIDGMKRKPKIDLNGVAIVVHSMPRRRSEHEPKEGRGLHIYFSKNATSEDGSLGETPSALGMSGGPLVWPEREGVLVGLVRSRDPFDDGYDQWCEPALEGIRLLTSHENPQVAGASKRILARLAVEQ